ncbi:MAG: hypothetical protein KDC84_13600 [Crocinitomicaceae bacterium]|nr:hypothetical protein [Crocinitomicaceae bacterium]
MNRNYFLFALILLLTFGSSFGQSLSAPQETISKKKPAYITYVNGEEIQAFIKSYKVKKGLFKSIKIEKADGTVANVPATEIKSMYAAPTGFEKLMNKVDFLSDIEKWGNEEIKGDYLNQGYGFYEQSKVKVKKKEQVLLLQLLNPSFCKSVKVYNDPFAKKTAGVGVAGVGVGYQDKSYYMKKANEEVAYLIEKKDYKGDFETIWKNCAGVKAKYEKIKWNEFVQHLISYTECE